MGRRHPVWRDVSLLPRPVPVLDRADRLRALTQSGLSVSPDPGMEHYARRVREHLNVPVALVSLVTADQQVFPGMSGLPEPWATTRCTPLSHSFCQYVVASEEPLVVDDARNHPWVRDNLAIPELGAIAYAGMPLTDAQGLVLGSLCAIDTVPRRWESAEMAWLADLAHGCSMELRLRLADHDSAREHRHNAEFEVALREALDRGQTLLSASQWLAQVSTVTEIRLRVGELISTALAPTNIGMVLLGDDERLHRVSHPDAVAGPQDAGPWATYGLDAPVPSATAVRERLLVQYSDAPAVIADYPLLGGGMLTQLNTEALIAAPLLAGDDALGALILGWDQPRQFSPMDLIVITSIAGYAAQALVRVRLLQHRISVAHELQAAMLATLPTVDGLAVGARYLPADAREEVGGDWYDLTRLPANASSGPGPVAVTVGDIVGHDVHAATIMGQVRSMLRQACWSTACESPATAITELEAACAGVGVNAAGTAVLAHLDPADDGSGDWVMTWTNAGHPPPLILHPDGTTTVLDGHDIMLGYSHLARTPRRDHQITLPPGAVVFLYTDGLVEQVGRDVDDGITVLRELLSTLRERGPQDIVDTVLKTLVIDAHDDTVALAVALQDPACAG